MRSVASDVMINFRTTREFGRALDQRAEEAGLSRSDFIRATLEEKVGALAVNGRPHWARNAKVKKAAAREEALPETSAADRAACSHPEDSVRRLPTGVKLCNLCGARLR